MSILNVYGLQLDISEDINKLSDSISVNDTKGDIETPWILREENKQLSGGEFINLDHYLDDLKDLDEGTNIVRFDI